MRNFETFKNYKINPKKNSIIFLDGNYNQKFINKRRKKFDKIKKYLSSLKNYLIIEKYIKKKK